MNNYDDNAEFEARMIAEHVRLSRNDPLVCAKEAGEEVGVAQKMTPPTFENAIGEPGPGGAPRVPPSLTGGNPGDPVSRPGSRRPSGDGEYNLDDELAATRLAVSELASMLLAINQRLAGSDTEVTVINEQLREAGPVMCDVARAIRKPLFDKLTDLSSVHGRDRQRRREINSQLKSLQRYREALEKRAARERLKSRLVKS